MTATYPEPALYLELEVAIGLARAAGAAAMAHYGTATPTAKADASPVTAADHAANDLIVQGLRRQFPADAILSEESTDSSARLSARRVWIVDPLDGTKEFLAQNGEFAIMIGLAIDGRAALGVVYLPANDVLYAAASGAGAWVEETSGERQPLRRSVVMPESIRLVISRSHPDALVGVMREKLHIDDVRRSGSVGIKCALIAADRRDLYVHPVSYLKEWDTCAPDAILREAGGKVTDCLGQELSYNKPDPRQPHGIFACAPGLFERVMPIWLTIYPQQR